MTRIAYQNANVSKDVEVFSELLMLVDSEFMQMFDFPIRSGNKFDLAQKENIAISDDIAVKYFGEEDPVG